MRIKDMTGQKIGKVSVLSFSHVSNHEAMWNCRCDCGKEWIVSGHNLRAGYTVSCGCYRNKNTGKRFTKHGQSYTRLYKTWRGMKKRCFNPKNSAYYLYGGKGITVCPEWLDFEVFAKWAVENGYLHNLTIDRIDSSGDYCPSNCQWLTRAENTRKATTKRGSGS